jgi:hypothetical protein
MCEEKYWEYDCKSFRERNWIEFVEKLHVKFPSDMHRTWKQVRDKWLRMREKYQEEKA